MAAFHASSPAVNKYWVVHGRDMIMHLANNAEDAVIVAGHRVVGPVEAVALCYLTHASGRFLHARRPATHMHMQTPLHRHQ